MLFPAEPRRCPLPRSFLQSLEGAHCGDPSRTLRILRGGGVGFQYAKCDVRSFWFAFEKKKSASVAYPHVVSCCCVVSGPCYPNGS